MRILLLSYVYPWPPTRGAAQRTNLLHRCLAEHGEVDMLLLMNGSGFTPQELQTLREEWGLLKCVPMLERGEYGFWKCIRPLRPSLVERLAHNFGRKTVTYGADPRIHAALEHCLAKRSYDLIVGRFLASVTKAGALGRLPVILDVDGLDSETYRSRLAAPGTAAWQRVALRHHLRQLERIVPAKLDACSALWVANESDRGQRGLERARFLPNIPFHPPGAQPPPVLPENPVSRVVLLIATMSYRPNVEAADSFLGQAWPPVRRAVPDAEFHIIGTGISNELRERWGAVPGVKPVGFVENLMPAYAGCAFTVAPIFSGGGTNV